MGECSVEHLRWGETWPSREQFHELADEGYRIIPIVRRLLADSLTPAPCRRAERNLHTRIGGIRRHMESIQLHRREFHRPAAFQQRAG